MSEETIALLTLVWYVISGLAVAAWVVMPVLLRYAKPRWQQRRYTQIIPSRRGATDLRRLAKILGQVGFWLSYGESELIRNVRHELFKVEHKIMTESLSYLALHSRKDNERCSALRVLSQVEGEESMRRVNIIIGGIATDPGTSKQVKRVAEASLKELEERREIAKVQSANDRAGANRSKRK